MVVWAEQPCALHADSAVAESSTFSGAGDDSNMLGHGLSLPEAIAVRMVVDREDFLRYCPYRLEHISCNCDV